MRRASSQRIIRSALYFDIDCPRDWPKKPWYYIPRERDQGDYLYTNLLNLYIGDVSIAEIVRLIAFSDMIASHV
jgi:hypothetical protein